MSQFIKKNHLYNNDHDVIDVISSTTSRPQSSKIEELERTENSASTDQSSTLKLRDTNRFNNYQNNTSIPDKIFQNYTFLPTNYKSKWKEVADYDLDDNNDMVNDEEGEGEDHDATKRQNNDGIIVNHTKNQDQDQIQSVDLATGTGTFKSALDIYSPASATSMISKDYANAKELESGELPHQIQDQNQDQSLDTMNTAIVPITPSDPSVPDDQLPPLPNDLLNSPLVNITTMTRIIKFLRYLIGKPDQRQPLPDPERQPLISPIESPIGSPVNSPINSPNSGYNGPGTGPGGPAYDLIGRYRQIFVILSLLLTLVLLVILLITGDSQLLALIFRALICYLLGDNAQKLLGEDFCPHYGWFWPWTA